jgi:hypothetical protein
MSAIPAPMFVFQKRTSLVPDATTPDQCAILLQREAFSREILYPIVLVGGYVDTRYDRTDP